MENKLLWSVPKITTIDVNNTFGGDGEDQDGHEGSSKADS